MSQSGTSLLNQESLSLWKNVSRFTLLSRLLVPIQVVSSHAENTVLHESVTVSENCQMHNCKVTLQETNNTMKGMQIHGRIKCKIPFYS